MEFMLWYERTAGVIPDPPTDTEFPAPDTDRAREAAEATRAQADGVETEGERRRRIAHQGRLQAYAIAIVALVAVLVALAATNTARVHVDWLVGSSRVSLVWLVLAAAIIGWILGVLASVRFQWLSRPERPRRHGRREQGEQGIELRRRAAAGSIFKTKRWRV
jgi:uncharacterized integral membrane protein